MRASGKKRKKLLRLLAGKSFVLNMENYKRLHLLKLAGKNLKTGLMPVLTKIMPPLPIWEGQFGVNAY